LHAVIIPTPTFVAALGYINQNSFAVSNGILLSTAFYGNE